MPLHDPTLPDAPAILDREDARAAGRGRRREVPRRSLATGAAHPRDPVAHLREQNLTRIPDLVPIRLQRMLANPFAFYRGTAGLMALDLADAPHSGILVAACGDAHIANFGFYASPERRVVFDLNDFDEAAVAPWEWDVKRMLASVVIGGRHAGYPDADVRAVCLDAFATYANVVATMAKESAVDRYFLHFNVERARGRLSRSGRAALRAALEGAERRTSARAVARTTIRGEEGLLQFVHRPPAMQRVELAALGGDIRPSQDILADLPDLYREYRSSVGVEIDAVLAQYAVRDLAVRVVGVGSVGTRCLLVLLEGADGDALVLQVKEAGPSVLERYGGIAQPARLQRGAAHEGEGFRVVGLQRTLQTVSDPFLGYLRSNGRDYYVRQFHDMKGSIELEGLAPAAFADYVRACAVVLGRAHAQSRTAGEIVGYIGRPDTLAEALLTWSLDYADRSAADFEAAREGFAGEYEPLSAG